MARPRNLSTVLTDDQMPLWREAGLEVQPFPVQILQRLTRLFQDALADGDVVAIKRLSDAMLSWYDKAVPNASRSSEADKWEELQRAFAAADAGDSAPA